MPDYAGYRTKKRMSQKREKKRRILRLLIIPVALVIVFIILFIILGAFARVSPVSKWWDKTAGGFKWLGRNIKAIWPWKGAARVKPARFVPAGKKTANFLFAFTKQLNGGTQVTTLVLASYDSRDRSGSLVYFPNDLLVSLPGVGKDVVSNLVELDEQRMSTTIVMVENVLGVQVDRYIMGSDRDLAMLFGNMQKAYVVDITEKLSFHDPSMNISLKLDNGKQALDPRQLASYLTYSEQGKELELISRQSSFVPPFLEKSGNPYTYNHIVAFMKKESDILDSDASSTEIAGIWQAYALLNGNKLQQATVPVKQFRYEKEVVHTVDSAKLRSFTKKYVKTDYRKPSGVRTKIEILNGNGVPGVGEKVSSRLDLSKFQIVNSANADNFNHLDTVIIIYSNDNQIVTAAEEIKKELEVGRIESHPKNQDIADITIIVGKDYANK
jgi:anionic cell wall polymer biosynthesis LytR-Cps2A-Psr (LCP) family protein